MDHLKGRSMLVTGASSGIGRAVALLLAESGCSITVADINEQGGHETVKLIESAGGTAQFVRTDISSEVDVERMVEKAVSQYGRLDGACNSAANMGCKKNIVDITVEEWDQCQSINTRGTFLCNKHQISAMQKTGGGSIVNISSTGAVKAFPGFCDYTASKSAILGITRSAALEYVDKNIRVNAILPGGTKTALVEDPGVDEVIASLQPLGRLAEPVEIATAVRWLLSDESSFATGACIPIDGGMTC